MLQLHETRVERSVPREWRSDCFVGNPEWDYRALLVGQAPSARCVGTAHKPLWRKDFMDICGGPQRYVKSFERHNLLHEFPGKSGRGDAFPMDEARDNALMLLSLRCTPERKAVVIALGRNVMRALTGVGKPHLKYFDKVAVRGEGYEAEVHLFPHPSRVNRFWNDEDDAARARQFLRDMSEQSLRRRRPHG